MWSVPGASAGGVAITARSPASKKITGNNVQVETLTVDGANFPAAPLVWLYWRKQPVIKATNVSVNAAGTRLTCDIDIGGFVPKGKSMSLRIAVSDAAGTAGTLSTLKFKIKK